MISDTNQTLQTKFELILSNHLGVPCFLQTQKQAEIIPIGKFGVSSNEFGVRLNSQLTTQNSQLVQAPDPDNAGVGRGKS